MKFYCFPACGFQIVCFNFCSFLILFCSELIFCNATFYVITWVMMCFVFHFLMDTVILMHGVTRSLFYCSGATARIMSDQYCLKTNWSQNKMYLTDFFLVQRFFPKDRKRNHKRHQPQLLIFSATPFPPALFGIFFSRRLCYKVHRNG